jgi:hypothetical protein
MNQESGNIINVNISSENDIGRHNSEIVLSPITTSTISQTTIAGVH